MFFEILSPSEPILGAKIVNMTSPDYVLCYIPRANGNFGKILKILETFVFFRKILNYNDEVMIMVEVKLMVEVMMMVEVKMMVEVLLSGVKPFTGKKRYLDAPVTSESHLNKLQQF